MNTTEEIKRALDQLIEDGKNVQGMITAATTYEFAEAYQRWYTQALKIVSLLGKDRLDEFCNYYLSNPNRDKLTDITYTIQDYLSGIRHPHIASEYVINLKYTAQFSILKSLSSRIDSVLSDVTGHLFSELQDNELRVASQLVDINLRAAGAVAGVVLEGHLQRVAVNHCVSLTKRDPTISDLNDPLKREDVYDLVTWRKIQHLADIRNICDHKKEREPTREDVIDLIEGTNKIIKTIF